MSNHIKKILVNHDNELLEIINEYKKKKEEKYKSAYERISSIEKTLKNISEEFVFPIKDSYIGDLTISWKAFQNPKYKQWHLVVETGNTSQRLIKAPEDLVIKIEVYLNDFLKFVKQQIMDK